MSYLTWHTRIYNRHTLYLTVDFVPTLLRSLVVCIENSYSHLRPSLAGLARSPFFPGPDARYRGNIIENLEGTRW